MFELDTLRLIKKTFKRFMSLLLIVLIGSSFMMGMFSARQIMEQSVDVYYDEQGFADMQLYSQYGFSDDDYLALKQTEGISQVFASKMTDLLSYSKNSDSEFVTRITEDYRLLNRYIISEGRTPQKADECVLLTNEMAGSPFKIGDRIYLTNDSDNVKETLKNDEFTLVGIAQSPEYMSKVMGPSNYKNQNLDLILYVPNENFLSDYYTTIFINLEGAEELVSMSKAYTKYVDEKKAIVEDIAAERQHLTRDQIIGKVEKQLSDSQETLKELKEITQQELDDAQRQLTDANIQLISYETQLSVLESTISSLESMAAQAASGPIGAAAIEGSEFLDSLGIDTGEIYDDYFRDYIREALADARSQYNSMRNQLASARKQYEDGVKEYAEGVKKFNEETEKAELQIRKAKQALEELPAARWMIYKRDANYSAYMYQGNAEQIGAIGIAMPVMFFLVAALVCLTTMKRLVDEQRGQIGIFVALGFSDLRVISKYVIYALIASLIGSIIGIIIGLPLFSGVIYWAWRMMYLSPPVVLSYPLKNVLISVLSFALLMGGVTAFVVKQTLGEVPAALMRPKAPKKAKEILLEKIPFIWNRLSFTSKITARNIFRYKSRFFMTVIGIAGCTGLLVLGFGVKDSVVGVVGDQFGNIFKYDYVLSFVNDEEIHEVYEKVCQDQQFESVFEYMSFSTKVYLPEKEATANTAVVDPRQSYLMMELTDRNGKDPLSVGNDGIIVSEKFAMNNDLHVGDVVRIESIDGIHADVTIKAICKMYFQHYIFMSESFYETVFDEEVRHDAISVKGGEKEDLLKIAATYETFSSLSNIKDIREQFSIMVGALNLIIYVIIITAGSLAFVVLMNLTQVNVSERIREIATLKVLGFNDREVHSYIFKEIILLTIIGAIIGMPIGVFENRFIMNELNMEMIMFGHVVKPISFVYSFLITMLFTLIVMFFMRKTLRDVNMVESLKSVE